MTNEDHDQEIDEKGHGQKIDQRADHPQSTEKEQYE